MTPLEQDALAKACRLLGHAQAFVRDACGAGFLPSFPAPPLDHWREWPSAHPEAARAVRAIVARTFDRPIADPRLRENQDRPRRMDYAQRLARSPASPRNGQNPIPG